MRPFTRRGFLVACIVSLLCGGCMIPREQRPPTPPPFDATVYDSALAAHHVAPAGSLVVSPLGAVRREGGLEIRLMVSWPGTEREEGMLREPSDRWRPARNAGENAASTRGDRLHVFADGIGELLSDDEESIGFLVVEDQNGRRVSLKPMRLERDRLGFEHPVFRAQEAIADREGRWGFVQTSLVRTDRDLSPGTYSLRLLAPAPGSRMRSFFERTELKFGANGVFVVEDAVQFVVNDVEMEGV